MSLTLASYTFASSWRDDVRGECGEADKGEPGDLFARIGDLLRAQGLSPDPANYAFAHHLLTRNDAEAVAVVERVLTDGLRLNRREMEELGGHVVSGTPAASSRDNDGDEGDRATIEAERLVAQTRAQVDTVAAMARAMHDETRDFGRSLAENAAQLDGPGVPAEIVNLTASMIRRAADAEERLAAATHEAETLRVELAEAQATARCDPLTGLPNRRAFDEAFAAIDPAQPHCLALCDIDRFKRINDEFGHLVGDRVLKALARLLSQHCEGHLVVRQGGEEFAVLLSGVEIADAERILEGARAGVAGRRLRDRDSDVPIGQVTFSAGVVGIEPGETREGALARADHLLYHAKARGRDRVVAG